MSHNPAMNYVASKCAVFSELSKLCLLKYFLIAEEKKELVSPFYWSQQKEMASQSPFCSWLVGNQLQTANLHYW